MKRNSIHKIIIAAFLASQVGFAAGPIVWDNTVFIKTLRPGIDLYMSTNGEHPNRYFTERTLFYQGEELDNLDLQKKTRNEICASDAIFRQADNQPLDASFLPGSMGIYKHGDEIAAIADTGLAGEPLSLVINKLSKLPVTSKEVIARYYAVNMAQIIKEIHRANILWNNVDLANFYVRPDGKLYAFDFSMAKRAMGAPAAIVAAKADEVKKLIAGPLLELYNKLFARESAYTKVTALLGAAPNTIADEGALTGAIAGALPNAPNAGATPEDNGINGAFDDGNVTNFLNNAVNVPRFPDTGIKSMPLLKVSHQTDGARISMIHLDRQVPQLMIDAATGLDYTGDRKSVV